MITAEPEAAATALERGQRVVLILRPHAPAVTAPAANPSAATASGATAHPGRLAILVGEPDDPATWTAAQAMEQELFDPAPRTGR